MKYFKNDTKEGLKFLRKQNDNNDKHKDLISKSLIDNLKGDALLEFLTFITKDESTRED